MEMLIKGLALVLCGAGVGATAVWMREAMRKPEPISDREVRRIAKALFTRLMEERGWTE